MPPLNHLPGSGVRAVMGNALVIQKVTGFQNLLHPQTPPPTGSHPEPKTKRLQWPLLPPPPLPESLWANRWFHLRDDHNKTPHPPCQTPKFQKNVLLLRGGAVLDFIRDSWSVVHFFLTKSTWKEAKLSRLLLMNCKTPQNWFTKVKYMKICICQVET